MCSCGAGLVWVRIGSNNHRVQFCSAWVARYLASGVSPFFTVED